MIISNKYPLYLSSSFEIEAIRITEENMLEVAEWCEGDVVATEEKDAFLYGPRSIRVNVMKDSGHTFRMARVGYWITYSGVEFKIYKDQLFRRRFTRKASSYQEKRNRIHQLVLDAMRRQDTETYNGTSSQAAPYAEEIADRIMQFL